MNNNPKNVRALSIFLPRVIDPIALTKALAAMVKMNQINKVRWEKAKAAIETATVKLDATLEAGLLRMIVEASDNDIKILAEALDVDLEAFEDLVRLLPPDEEDYR